MATRAQMEPRARELDARCSDGIDVSLWWHPADDSLTVEVVAGDESLRLHVAPGEALDAFHHPFAYAAHRQVSFSTEIGVCSDHSSTTSALGRR